MNSATLELPIQRARGNEADESLAKLKKDLLHAEVRLAKARATAAGAEVDIKVLNVRLKAHLK